MKIFCIDINNSNLNKIKRLNYIPVGLGENNFNEEWLQDNSGDHISEKNPYYGEYTFHYWLWKNYLDKIEDEWIGFCQYRKFWSVEKDNLLPNSLDELRPLILNEIPKSYENYDVILGDEYFRV